MMALVFSKEDGAFVAEAVVTRCGDPDCDCAKEPAQLAGELARMAANLLENPEALRTFQQFVTLMFLAKCRAEGLTPSIVGMDTGEIPAGKPH